MAGLLPSSLQKVLERPSCLTTVSSVADQPGGFSSAFRSRLRWSAACLGKWHSETHNWGIELMNSFAVALCACVLLSLPGRASAATITVNAGGDLQAAINAAQPGDTILLQAGAVFTGNYKL